MKILKIFLVLVVLMVFVGAGAGVGLYYWAQEDLPGFTKLSDYSPSLATTVRARDGRVLGYFYREKRFLIPLSMMSPITVKAFLAAEDAGFYQHEGVDLPGIFRAAVKNFIAGGIVQGGSTITQQVIKSMLLTPERSYERKIKEIILAYRLEKYLNKDEILTIYLNQIFLGSKAYGVEAASREYFGISASQLSLAQAALLAGLPKAPSRYSPYGNPERARERQLYVLSRLRDLGWVGREEFEAAVNEPLKFGAQDDPSWKIGPYYLEEVRRQLVERPSCCFWRMCRWGRRWSRPMRKAAPAMRPQTMGMKCRRPIWEAISAAGCSRPRKAAPSIMPPAAPSMQSMARRENSRRRKMALAPRLTEIQERMPASRDCRMG